MDAAGRKGPERGQAARPAAARAAPWTRAKAAARARASAAQRPERSREGGTQTAETRAAADHMRAPRIRAGAARTSRQPS